MSAMPHRPGTFEEALAIRASVRVVPYAGGTDLMVRHHVRGGLIPSFAAPPLFIGHLTELRGFRREPDGMLAIGACATLAEVLEAAEMPAVLRLAVAEMASPGVRSCGTIGGNVMNASPAADALMPLIALGGQARLRSAKRVRRLPLERFVTGPGRTDLEPDELLEAILVPADEWPVVRYRKIGTRNADALSKVSFAGLLRRSADGTAADLRIAVGAVAPTVVRSREAEMFALAGEPVRAAGCLEALIRPIDDQRSTADYRRTVAMNLIWDFLRECIDQGEESK